MSHRLNLGCGTDIRAGWLNLDKFALPGVDVCHDIQVLPLPFDEDSFDEVLCKDILEHVEYIPLLGELHRILKPGGRLVIQVPHFTSKDAVSDPTHIKFFTSHTFRYFTVGHMRSYYSSRLFSQMLDVKICFDKRLGYAYNYLLELAVNASPRLQNYYEGSPLRIFPATNLQLVLVK